VSRFEDFVDAEGLDPGERARLERVHELLLEVGPPPELTSSLTRLPDVGGRVVPLPTRRRIGAAIALAAALAAAAFGGGYVLGNGHGGFSSWRVEAMTGRNALGSVAVGAPDTAGNWPIRFKETGLPKLTGKDAYYEVFVVHDGKPRFPCGGFRVTGGARVSANFTVPYEVTGSTRWVVTAIDANDHWPGRVVMT